MSKNIQAIPGLLVVATIGFILGLSFQSEGQTQQSVLSKLATNRASLSELDWIFLKSNIELLKLMTDFEPGITHPDYSYDATSGRVQAFATISPTLLSQSTLEALRIRLQRVAELACERPFLEQPFLGLKGAGDLTLCAMRFDTWEKGKPRPVAIYQNGKITFD